MNKLDYKKAYKELYMPKNKPMVLDVPSMVYVMVEGKGDPNTSKEYKQAISLLYAISFTIKMSKMGQNKPEGYFEYVVPPLEGLWWVEDEYFDGINVINKEKLHWFSMIRLPEFVSQEYFEQVKKEVQIKKPDLNVKQAHYFEYEEGLCVQIMHKGSYDDEPMSLLKMNQFLEENDYICDISEKRYHHEIYLSDPRRTKAENLRTVIRHPIKIREE